MLKIANNVGKQAANAYLTKVGFIAAGARMLGAGAMRAGGMIARNPGRTLQAAGTGMTGMEVANRTKEITQGIPLGGG